MRKKGSLRNAFVGKNGGVDGKWVGSRECPGQPFSSLSLRAHNLLPAAGIVFAASYRNPGPHADIPMLTLALFSIGKIKHHKLS